MVFHQDDTMTSLQDPIVLSDDDDDIVLSDDEPQPAPQPQPVFDSTEPVFDNTTSYNDLETELRFRLHTLAIYVHVLQITEDYIQAEPHFYTAWTRLAAQRRVTTALAEVVVIRGFMRTKKAFACATVVIRGLLREKKAIACAMALHPRLGRASALGLLPESVLHAILSFANVY